MKARRVNETSSSPAPEEWLKLDAVEAQRPNLRGHESSLQRYDGTNLCRWYVRSKVFWEPHGEILIVE